MSFSFGNRQITTIVGALELARMNYNQFSVDAKKEGQDRIADQFQMQANDCVAIIERLEQN